MITSCQIVYIPPSLLKNLAKLYVINAVKWLKRTQILKVTFLTDTTGDTSRAARWAIGFGVSRASVGAYAEQGGMSEYVAQFGHQAYVEHRDQQGL